MAEWKGVHYSDNDMLNMQQEAIRRVRQMQQRARQSIGAAQEAPPAAPSPPPAAGPAPAHLPVEERQPPHPQQGQPAGSGPGLGELAQRLGRLIQNSGEEERGLSGLLDSVIGDSPAARALEALGIDGERLLLIGLLLLLMNEKADRTLLIALVYLLF